MKALLGFACGVVSLFSLLCATMSTNEPGLFVFFAGVTAMTGTAAVRLLRGKRDVVDAPSALGAGGIDIALEAQVLRLAAAEHGRITVAEVALGCGVSLDVAAAALDQLVARGHADLAVADNGSTVYVVHGFVSVEAKHEAEAVA